MVVCLVAEGRRAGATKKTDDGVNRHQQTSEMKRTQSTKLNNWRCLRLSGNDDGDDDDYVS